MIRKIRFKGKSIIFDEKDDVDQSVATEIFGLREYRVADDVIFNAKTIIDVGAHIGLFTLYCKVINPTVKVISLEPESQNLSRLKYNLKKNKTSGVKVIPEALAGKTGKAKLIITPDSHNHRLSIEESSEQGITVKIVSLSDLRKRLKLKQIDLLKMDIEGGEYDVFDNLGSTDWKCIKNIILEYHEEDHARNHKGIEQLLRENGFGVQVFPSKFDRHMGFMFAHNKKI